jgi:hypothetical protein
MELLDGTMPVPGGSKIQKKYIVIPAGIALAYITYRWYQANQTDTTTASDGTYSTDDLTDMGLSTTGGATSVTGNTGSTVTDGTTDGSIDTNVQWSNAAIERLTNQGYDGAVVGAALGEFLDRQHLDKTEATIVRAAIAVAGQPPENRPWSILEEASTGTGTMAAPTNLKVAGTPTSTTISMTWDKVDGTLYYRIYRGTGENVGSSADNAFKATGLQPDTAYPFSVAAVNTSGKTGGRSSIVTMRTARVTLTKPTGLKSSAVGKSSFRVSCTPVKGATYYRWYLNGHGVSPSDQPYRDFTGLKGKTTYSVSVAADTTNQTPGPTSSALKVKTK